MVEEFMKSNLIYLLIGIPGSGKTFYRENYFKKLAYLSCDEIREQFFGLQRSFEIRQKVRTILQNSILDLSIQEIDFVIDSTYFNKVYERLFLFEHCPNHKIIAVYIKTPLQKAILQNNLRESHRVISQEMIEKFNNEIEPPTDTELFFDIQVIE